MTQVLTFKDHLKRRKELSTSRISLSAWKQRATVGFSPKKTLKSSISKILVKELTKQALAKMALKFLDMLVTHQLMTTKGSE
jgi:hypothetical protein